MDLCVDPHPDRERCRSVVTRTSHMRERRARRERCEATLLQSVNLTYRVPYYLKFRAGSHQLQSACALAN